jgi:large subunit ribosomal protein L14e
MPVIEIGRICVKTRGREAGKKCVIVDIIDDNFVLITGPKKVNGVKRRRVNILHIEPTDKKIDISKGATDDEVEKKLSEAGLVEWMKESIKVKIPVI